MKKATATSQGRRRLDAAEAPGDGGGAINGTGSSAYLGQKLTRIQYAFRVQRSLQRLQGLQPGALGPELEAELAEQGHSLGRRDYEALNQQAQDMHRVMRPQLR
jgi:hypothetical protein